MDDEPGGAAAQGPRHAPVPGDGGATGGGGRR